MYLVLLSTAGEPDVRVGSVGPAVALGNVATGAVRTSRGVDGRVRPESVAGGGDNVSSVLGGNGPVEYSSVRATAGAVMRESGMRPPAGHSLARGNPRLLPEPGGGMVAPSTATTAGIQASTSAWLCCVRASATAAPIETNGRGTCAPPSVPGVPVERPPLLPKV